jgi:hypothetical protein
MNLDYVITQLADHAGMIQSLVGSVSAEQARWKPSSDVWSVLEIIHHLYDEEREDFRRRLDHVLSRPDQTWPGIDPLGWVVERRYNEQNLDQMIVGFLQERDQSLKWLKGLVSPNWQISYQAPWGAITAGDLLASWVAHDLLHTRQLVELLWAYTTHQLEPYKVEYAGQW